MSWRPGTVVLALVLAGVAGACATLLGIKDEDEPRGFPHHPHVVEGIACVDCHGGIQATGDHGPLHLPNEQICVDCHEDPHDPRPCFQCHAEPTTRRHAAERREYILFSHQQHMDKVKGNCVRCHTGVQAEGGNPSARMATCLGCHEHKDEYRIRQCEACHVDLSSEAAVPETHLIHDANFIQQHGVQAASTGDLCSSCHQESFCAQCHGVTVPMLPSKFTFEDTMRRTMHRANFFARHAEEARGQPGLCQTCHQERFCSNCHLEEDVHATVAAARNPHPQTGWVGALGSSNEHGRAARRDPASCASCHGGAGQMLCVSCHRVGGIGGSPHPPGWDSRKDLSEIPCRLCHTPGMP